MNPDDLNRLVLTPALGLLPARMDTDAARAMLIAVALQESGLQWREQQDGDDDPYDDAVGWWQFERIGAAGVREHPASSDYMAGVLHILGYAADHRHTAIAHNDLLAAAYARLLLWRLPKALPLDISQGAAAWEQYIEAWRPGKPRRSKWTDNWKAAWACLNHR